MWNFLHRSPKPSVLLFGGRLRVARPRPPHLLRHVLVPTYVFFCCMLAPRFATDSDQETGEYAPGWFVNLALTYKVGCGC